jgi:hypothetical protein
MNNSGYRKTDLSIPDAIKKLIKEFPRGNQIIPKKGKTF